MTSAIDQLLARITALSDDIGDPGISPSTRESLVDKREALRDEARQLADQARHPASVAAEIEMLEARLSEIDGFLITKGHSEKYLTNTIADPSAYSANINASLGNQYADEVATIERRLARLRALTEDQPGTSDPRP